MCYQHTWGVQVAAGTCASAASAAAAALALAAVVGAAAVTAAQVSGVAAAWIGLDVAGIHAVHLDSLTMQNHMQYRYALMLQALRAGWQVLYQMPDLTAAAADPRGLAAAGQHQQFGLHRRYTLQTLTTYLHHPHWSVLQNCCRAAIGAH